MRGVLGKCESSGSDLSDSRRSSGDAFLPQSRSQSGGNDEALRQAVLQRSVVMRHVTDSTGTGTSTSSSGGVMTSGQCSGAAGRHPSQESRKSSGTSRFAPKFL